MEGSYKGFSSSNTPSSPLVPKSPPSGSGVNNENDTSEDQIISKLHNSKKTVAKHFMSPTISASSKIAVPRKKILAERNENSSSSDTQIWKTRDMDMKNSIGHYDLSPSWFIPSKNCGRVSNDDGVVADSSLKPYDPSTNYLSPRPKYLRYDPNKRRTIVHRKVSESRDRKDGTGIGEEESSADSQDPLVHAQENEEILGEVDVNTDDDGDVEDEDEDEEEEDEEAEEYEERGWNLRGVFKFLLTFYVCFLSKTYICSMNFSTPSPIQQAILGFKDYYPMIQKQICEAAYMEVYGGSFLEVEERDSGLDVLNTQTVQGDNLETVDSAEAEIVEEDELDMEDRNTKTIDSPSNRDYEANKNSEPYNVQVVEVDNVQKVKNGEVELFEVDNVETAQSDDAGSYELVKEVEGSDRLKKPDSFEEDQTPLNTEGANQPDMELLESHEMPVNLVDEEFDYGGETEKVGSNILVAAGVSTFSIILASLAFVYRSRKGKTTSIEDSQPTLKPLKSTVEDKITRVQLTLEEEHIEKTMTPGFPAEEEESIGKEIESSSRPLSLSNSIAEAPQEAIRFIHAPTIELLGEIVIKEVGSSHRKIIPVLESEESNASQKGSKSRPVPVPSQTFTQEISNKDPPSYGSVTDGRKILKKEGGKYEEPNMEFNTPIRRSSRIRNRTVMSP